MFAARICVGTVSGFSRTLADQININGSRLSSNSLVLQLPKKFHSPKCEFPIFSWNRRSSKHGDQGKTSKDSTQPRLFQKILDETNTLKVALDLNSEKIDKLNENVQSVLQHLRELQVDRTKERPHIHNQNHRKTPPPTDRPNKPDTGPVPRKRKANFSNNPPPKKQKVDYPDDPVDGSFQDLLEC